MIVPLLIDTDIIPCFNNHRVFRVEVTQDNKSFLISLRMVPRAGIEPARSCDRGILSQLVL